MPKVTAPKRCNTGTRRHRLFRKKLRGRVDKTRVIKIRRKQR